MLHGMWDLPRPGLKPLSPALAGRFLTTAPPGKSSVNSLKRTIHVCFSTAQLSPPVTPFLPIHPNPAHPATLWSNHTSPMKPSLTILDQFHLPLCPTFKNFLYFEYQFYYSVSSGPVLSNPVMFYSITLISLFFSIYFSHLIMNSRRPWALDSSAVDLKQMHFLFESK